MAPSPKSIVSYVLNADNLLPLARVYAIIALAPGGARTPDAVAKFRAGLKGFAPA